MEIKKLANNVLIFIVNRFIEIFGMSIIVMGVFLLISLNSFSPDDPNFIFTESIQIKNLLGYRGSFLADFFFQSFGLISLLIPFSLVFTGTNIILNKKIFFLIESNFFTVLYLLCGSLFFSIFYTNTFELYINGNGGFIGKYLGSSFLKSLINFNTNITYYLLILLILSFFLISIQFNIRSFCKITKRIFGFLFSNKQKVIPMKMK